MRGTAVQFCEPSLDGCTVRDEALKDLIWDGSSYAINREVLTASHVVLSPSLGLQICLHGNQSDDA